MRIALVTLLAVAVWLCPAHAASSFTTTHIPNDEAAHFSFPSGESESYYTDAMLALKVESVYADGVALTAMPHDSTLRSHIKANIYRPVLPTKMIYQLHYRQFISVLSRSKSGVANLVSYEIPMDAKKIEISYRVRYPNGKISQEMSVTSLSSYDFKEVNDK